MRLLEPLLHKRLLFDFVTISTCWFVLGTGRQTSPKTSTEKTAHEYNLSQISAGFTGSVFGAGPEPSADAQRHADGDQCPWHFERQEADGDANRERRRR